MIKRKRVSQALLDRLYSKALALELASCETADLACRARMAWIKSEIADGLEEKEAE